MKTPSPIWLVSTLLAFTVGSVAAEEAQILSIRQAGDEITVAARVPVGFRKVTLEARGADGSWQPRSVRRTDGSGALVNFQVPVAEHFEWLRVRAEQTEKLAAKFFHGASSFEEYSASSVEAAPEPAHLTLAGTSGGGTIIFHAPVADEFALFPPGPYRIDDLFPVGEYLVEVSHSGGTNNSGVVRVALAAEPQVEVAKLDLQNGAIRASTVKGSKLYLLQSVDDSSKFWIGLTREQAVTLSILDLANLPNLTLAGEVRTNLTLAELAYDIQAVWPSEDILVFASAGSARTVRFRKHPVPQRITFHSRIRIHPYPRPEPVFIPSIKIVPLQPGFFPVAFPIVYPVISIVAPWSAEPELIAFNVADAARPEFASKVSMDPIVSSAASEFYATNGRVYLSHTVTESQVTGSNSWVMTVPEYRTITNIAPVTRVVSVPHRVVTTNEVTRTEIEVAITGIDFVTNVREQVSVNRFVRSEPDSLAAGLTALAAGSLHSVSLDLEGRIDAWGNSFFHQLGSSMLSTLPEIASLAAGNSHTLALDNEGGVWGWGANFSAQVVPAISPFPAPFPVLSQPAPVNIPGLPPAAGLAAGFAHSLALAQNGEVWAWGNNASGQLGAGDSLPRNGPTAVRGLSNIVSISAGSAHNLALDNHGRLYAWGDNSQGQLGLDESILYAPTLLVDPLEIVAIAAGDKHTLLLSASGEVFASGHNARGALGNGSRENRGRFERVSGLPFIVQVGAGRDHSLAVDDAGGIWAWGRNDFGQSDAAAGEDVLTPRKVRVLPPVSAVAGGGGFTLALTRAGEMWGWGDNSYGQLGGGAESIYTNYFQVTDVRSVTNYVYHTNTMVEFIVTTNLVYSRETNTVLRTNIVQQGFLTRQTNWYNTYREVNKSYANVVDFHDATSPVVRRPVSIPGKLAGLSHGGEILYTTAAHSSANGEFEGQWVEAVSYDGTAAYHLDGKRVAGSGAPIVEVAQNRVFVLDETGTNLHVFQLSDAPSLDPVGTIAIPPSREMEVIGSRIAVKTLSSSILLFDPQTLSPIGKCAVPPSAYFPVEDLAAGPDGFWVPRGWQPPLELVLQQE